MKATLIVLGAFAAGLVVVPVYAQTTSQGAAVKTSPDLLKLDAPSNPSDLIKPERKTDAAAVDATEAANEIDPNTSKTTLGGANASGTPDGGAVDTTGMSSSAAAAAEDDTPSGGLVPGQEVNN